MRVHLRDPLGVMIPRGFSFCAVIGILNEAYYVLVKLWFEKVTLASLKMTLHGLTKTFNYELWVRANLRSLLLKTLFSLDG